MIQFDASQLQATVTDLVSRIGEAAGESTLRSTGFAGAEVFREEAKRNAAKNAKTFTIHRNIIVKRLEELSDAGQRQVYLVTVRKGNYGGSDAFYWRFVEDGHAKVRKNKTVSKKTGKVVDWKRHRANEERYWQKKAAEMEFGSARVPAKPFIRPAYESKKQEAADAMASTLTEQLAKNLTGS